MWLALEAERLRYPIFRRFYSERSIVLKEVTALTGGRTTLGERFLQELFKGAAVAHPLAGDLTQISAIDRPTALAYFHRFYRPENIAIAIVGNVDPSEMFELFQQYFADWQPEGAHEGLRSRLHEPPPPTTVRSRIFSTPQGSAIYFAFPRLGPGQDERQAAILEALAAAINSPDSSPVLRRIAQERGMAATVRALPNYPSQKQTSVFMLQIFDRRGVSDGNLSRDAAAALREMDNASDEDLRAGILSAELNLASQLDDMPTLASLLAFHQAVNDDWEVPFRQLELLQHLTPDDIREAAHLLFGGLLDSPATAAGR